MAGPETTVLGGVSAPSLCCGVWRQDWAALDKVLRVLGSVRESEGPWTDAELPANEELGCVISWKNKRCPYLYPELVRCSYKLQDQSALSTLSLVTVTYPVLLYF